ncbi:hypothetical protein U9M48_031260 [Paspalum notatum var. saurae]|uniref:Uncharacterized protein n=1 Tax=Paspalum notatum var. saurae TaxID=547442 RepID=A0AAQ3X480_PASNO
MDLLLETKRLLCSNYDMKDLGEASYVLGIQIHRDRNRCILGLSQKTCIENALKKICDWKHYKALRYLQGTKDMILTYRKTDALQFVGYADTDWAGCKDTKKSTSGYVFTLAGGAVSWKSCKQSIIASSTMYTEIIACFEATGQAMWLKKFIPGLRVVDIDYFHHNRSSGARKHIDIKFYVVKEKIQDQTIDVEHLGTEEMLADPLTKRRFTQSVE